jgi:hypothetical protein
MSEDTEIEKPSVNKLTEVYLKIRDKREEL